MHEVLFVFAIILRWRFSRNRKMEQATRIIAAIPTITNIIALFEHRLRHHAEHKPIVDAERLKHSDQDLVVHGIGKFSAFPLARASR